MPDAVELTKTIKKAAIQAVQAEKPVDICFGKVTSKEPLKILVDQKMILGRAQLVLTRNVTDFSVETTADGLTDGENEKIKKVTAHNGLVVGDEVILIRQQGGQKYIVVDRTG